MNFSEALERMKAGDAVRRKIWTSIHLFIADGVIRSCPGGVTDHIHRDNIVAEDWEVATPRENCACVTHFRMPAVKVSEPHPDTARLDWLLNMLFRVSETKTVPVFLNIQQSALCDYTDFPIAEEWLKALAKLRKEIDDRIEPR